MGLFYRVIGKQGKLDAQGLDPLKLRAVGRWDLETDAGSGVMKRRQSLVHAFNESTIQQAGR
jgi:hypothetical protein